MDSLVLLFVFVLAVAAASKFSVQRVVCTFCRPAACVLFVLVRFGDDAARS